MVEVCGALKHQRLPTASPQVPRTDFPQEAAPLRDSFRMVANRKLDYTDLSVIRPRRRWMSNKSAAEENTGDLANR
jgi:hypothetical protein